MTRKNQTAGWLEILRPNPQARLRLLCLPYAGGGTHFFRDWPTHLPPWVEVWVTQLPGRERRLREPPVANLQKLVGEIVEALLAHRDLPFVFFGHSMGALLVFEIARQLRRQRGPSPIQLIVSGHRAPQLPEPDPPIHQLPKEEFLEEVRRYNGIPEEVVQSKELLEIVLPALQADFTACETAEYIDEPPLACAISAYGGLEDPKVDRVSLEAWRDQTEGDFVLRLVPGDHFYIANNQKLFFELLTRELSDAMTIGT